MGADIPLLRRREGRRARKDLESPAGNGKRLRRGAGKTNDLLPHTTPEKRETKLGIDASDDLEGQANSTRAAPSPSGDGKSPHGATL